jgi:hypothetical protein
MDPLLERLCSHSPFEFERLKSAAKTRLLLDGAAMLSSTTVRAPVQLMAIILVAQMSLGSRADGQENQIQARPTRTAKELLGGRASDEHGTQALALDPGGPTMIIPSYVMTLWALLFVSCGPTVAQSVAVFDFELIDTSLEGAIRGRAR